MVDQHGRRNGVLLAMLVVGCLLLARPYAEMGVIDDWSYIATAREFAQTGRVVYNGWATAMLGWIVPASAVGIKLLGFSFTHARLFMLPVTGLAVYLFYRILSAFGIHRDAATFGTLALFLSPGCFLLEFTLMTDVPGLLAMLLCLRLCQKAVSARTAGSTIAWLWAATLTNLLAGSARQIGWLGALAMVPATAWMLRRRKGVLANGVVLALVAVLGAKAFLFWFNRHPYAVPEPLARNPVGLHMVGHLGFSILRGLLCLQFLLLPATLAWVWHLRQRPVAARLRALAVASLATGAFSWLAWTKAHGDRPISWLVPSTLHVLDSMGLAPPSMQEMLGQRVVVEGTQGRVALSVLSFVAAYCVWDWLATSDLHLWGRLRGWLTSHPPEDVCLDSWTSIAWLVLPLLLANMLMLLPRAATAMMFDRYLLVFLMLGLILLLRLHQDKIGRVLPQVSVAALVAFSLFAIAGTHDFFSLYRARVATANQVVAAGIPMTQVQGGFDFDGWTEIQTSGHVVENQQNAATVKLTGGDCSNWFAGSTPHIEAHYFVSRSPVPRCFDPSQFAPVDYSTWMPPFHRHLFVLVPKPEFRNAP